MGIKKITLFFSVLILIISLFISSCKGKAESPRTLSAPLPTMAKPVQVPNFLKKPKEAPPPVMEMEYKTIPKVIKTSQSKEAPPPIAEMVVIKAEPTVYEIPQFPWPPPKASASTNIPQEFLRKTEDAEITLAEVDLKLTSALEKCGYYEKSYFGVHDGFALVTRLEQINPDGTSIDPPDRWSIKVKSGNFSLSEYIKALFTANPGHFRIIVFICTPHPFSQTEASVSRDEATIWLASGLNKLPKTIGVLKYSKDYSSTALIYEFEKPSYNENAKTKLPSDLSGRIHLEKAKIWKALEE